MSLFTTFVHRRETGVAADQAACLDLMASIEEDRLPEANIYEARMTVEMITAVFASHRIRQPVQIPLQSRQHPLGTW